MSVTTVEAFLEQLRQSNLLSAEAWENVQAETEGADADVSPQFKEKAIEQERVRRK